MAYQKIESREDYLLFLEADKYALGLNTDSFKEKIKRFFFPHYVWNFQKTLRKAEYYKNCKRGLLSKIIFACTMKRYYMLSVKLGFDIPLNTFGPGLSIPHHGTIVVNHNAKIGANCRLHVCTNIGASAGIDKAPTIGDNCYIGPGAKIYGDISIADNTIIAANAAVGRSFEESGISIAGVPAKKIGEFDAKKVILLSYQAAKKGLKRDNLSLSKEELNKMIESL